MSDELTETQERKMNSIVEYIQLKERTLAALNAAISRESVPSYGQTLIKIANLLIKDKIPLEGVIDTAKYFPNLYPTADEEQKGKKEKSSEDE